MRNEQFALRYVELKPSQIFNMLDPINQNCAGSFWEHWGDTWWEPETIEKRKKYREFYIQEHDKITKHYSSLEKSIAQEGILRPINLVTGPNRDKYLRNPGKEVGRFFPQHMIDDPQHAVYTHTHGGSRLYIAEKLGFETVPCVVHDFSNLFTDGILVTKNNFREWYSNDYMFNTKYNIRIINKNHHHMARNSRYRAMNSATRAAQKETRRWAVYYTKKYFNIPVD